MGQKKRNPAKLQARARVLPCATKLQWVTRYKLLYYDKGWKWFNKQFHGNVERYHIKANAINPPFRATKVRLYVEGWRSHICMRAEFEGCKYVDPKNFKGPAGAKGPPGAKGDTGVA